MSVSLTECQVILSEALQFQAQEIELCHFSWAPQWFTSCNSLVEDVSVFLSLSSEFFLCQLMEILELPTRQSSSQQRLSRSVLYTTPNLPHITCNNHIIHSSTDRLLSPFLFSMSFDGWWFLLRQILTFFLSVAV